MKDELRRILDKDNPRFLEEVKERLDAFYRLVQFFAVVKKVVKPPMPTDRGILFLLSLTSHNLGIEQMLNPE